MNKYIHCKETGSLDVLEGEIPSVPNKGFLVKVSFCGICHTDAHIYSENVYREYLPRIMGHEISGTIHEIGKDCDRLDFHVDDRVVVFPFGGCRTCNPCKVDNQNCLHRRGSITHQYGFWKDGGFQQYIAIVDPWSVVHVPADLPLDVACTVTCGGITAYNAVSSCKDAVTEAIRVDGEAAMLINGVGGVGLWAVNIARAMYGPMVKICGVDIYEDKLVDAKSAGADLTLCVPKDGHITEISEKIVDCFGGKKVDAAIDFVNSPVTIERIYHTLNLGSTLALVGLYNDEFPPIKLIGFTTRNIRFQGVYAGRKMHISKLFQMILNGKVKGPTIEHVRLEDVKNILNKMIEGELKKGRAVVTF